MKKLLSLALALCLSLLPALTTLANAPVTEGEDPELPYNETDTSYNDNSPYNYTNEPYSDIEPNYNGIEPDYTYTEPEHEPEPTQTSSESFEHFATATIEELHAYDEYTGRFNLAYPPEEIPCFDPPPPPPVIPPPRYSSEAVVIMDADTGLVLYGSEHHTQLYPASITKIMTALIVLEHVQDLQERIEFSYNSIWSIPRSSSHIAMDEGETLTVYQALYGLMLSSANEVSIALAEHVSGTVEAFAELMNHKASSLGATNTHFVNPSGLPDYDHVTTAYDMALIMREAIRHPIFVEIISTRRFDIPPTERQSDIRPLRNTNQLIHPGPYFNEWVIGSKTGWTAAARHTLVTYAEHEGRRLIISTLKAESGGTFMDTLALLSFGFSMPFEERRVFEASAYIRMVPVYQYINSRPLNIGYATLRADSDLHFMLPADFDIRDLRYELSIPYRVAPPVQVGDSLGQVAVYVQDIRAGEVELFAQNLVLALPVSDTVEESGAGGGDYGLPTAGYTQTGGYYPSLAVYPTSIWANEYIQTMALPIALFVFTLIVSLIIIATSRKRRMRKILNKRYVKYSRSYRYR